MIRGHGDRIGERSAPRVAVDHQRQLVAREQLQPAFAPISQLVGQSGPSAALPEIELKGPFVQVLPLAIYI
jgi:hypothetical protein